MSALGRLGVDLIEAAALRLTSIIARAHRCGWIHGDIKPGNVLVGPDGSVHLVDWAAARRIGVRAPPGTLGYAPPWAWSESRRAEPRDDYYMLAVTLWEAWQGRRAFEGDRNEILARQTGFAFPDAAAAPSTLANLLSCASAGTDMASIDQAALRADEIRADVVASRLIRPMVIGPARVVARAGGEFVDLALPVDRRDLAAAADALVVELRLEQGRNALRWRELVDRACAAASDAPPDDAVSRVDRLRDRAAAVEAGVERVLSTIERPLVVACPDEVAAEEGPAWERLRARGTSEEPDGRAAWTLVRPRCAVAEVDAEGRDRSRDVVEEVFGASSVSDRLAVAAAARWTGSVMDAALDAVVLAAAGRIVWSGGFIDASPDLSQGELEASVGGGRALGAPGTDSGSVDRDPVEAALDLGETSALRGGLDATLRACIRAHTLLSQHPRAPAEQVLRLADLWTECGRGDAAEAILKSSPACDGRIDVALRLARVAAARGDAAGLEFALSRVNTVGLPASRAAEFERLNALLHIHRREFRSAHALLKRALNSRERLPPRGRLWLLMTLANVLRMLDRKHSARRILRALKRRAAHVGGARLQVAVDSNLVIARLGDAPPLRMANDAWAIAMRCFSVGMMPEGLVNALTAANYWLAAGEREIALQRTLDVVGLESFRHFRQTSIGKELVLRRIYAMDLSEDWEGVERLFRLDSAIGGAVVAPLHRDLISDELVFGAVNLGSKVKSDRSSSRERLIVLAMCRLVVRPVVSPRALGVLLQNLDEVSGSYLPIVGHAARSVVRRSSRDGGLRIVLQTARHDRRAGDSASSLGTALHAAALAWAASVDADAVEWFVTNAPIDDRRRPAGIRSWEWRLARRRAEIEAGRAEPDDRDAEAVLEEMEAAVGRIWPEARDGYARRLPFRNVARLAGCELTEEEEVAISEDAGGRFNRIRAVLYRRRIGEERGGKRAAGLERVLRSALSLQSATDIDRLLGEVVSGVAAVCRAERAVVVYGGDRREGRAKVAAGGEVSAISQAEAEVSLTAVARVRKTRRACVIDDACGDEGLEDRPSVMRYRPRSLIIAPLQTQGQFLGYIYVENRSAAKSFDVSDVELVEGFAAQAAFALENAQLVEELRRSCEDLDRARNEAVRAESLRVVGRMASEVAHDFNNLLTAVLGETQLLMQSEDLRRHVDSLSVIERAALDGAEVIRRLQATTRVKDPGSLVVVQMREVARNVLDMTRWRAASARIEVHCAVPDELPVRGVPSELREVLTNLVVNAIDAMPGGGTLRIVGTREGPDAVIDVVDTGQGMDAVTAAKAFDPFFTTKGEKGNGLGLSIACGIMQRHGGDIRIESRPGAGTRMRLRLPIARESSAVVAEPASQPISAERRGPPERALVIDDEPAVARILSAMLRRSGVDVEVSIGGVAGLSRLRAQESKFDLVITDVNMPDVSGLDVAVEALRTRNTPRVVLMSGSLGGHEEATARSLGVQVLRKPFTIRDIDRLTSAS